MIAFDVSMKINLEVPYALLLSSHLGIYERRFYDNRWKQVPSKKVDHNL